MARSRQFIDGWRHAEKSLVAWLHGRSRCMGDPRARDILNVTADEFGKWTKGRYRISDRQGPPDPQDPLALFRAAVRREALEEAARIVEGFAAYPEQGTGNPAHVHRSAMASAIRAAMAKQPEDLRIGCQQGGAL